MYIAAVESMEKNKSKAVANNVGGGRRGAGGGFGFVDNRPAAITQRKLQEKASNSHQAKQATRLQATSDNYTAQQHQPIQKKENNTGLPDNLKSGIENLSGYSLDDVKVHYNSDKPTQLQAHAFAQGTDIHLATGQEKHLPHEAWHVVQQKHGRVKPTKQMKGKVNVNDDADLEKEADVMGTQSLQFSNSTHPETGEAILHRLAILQARTVSGVVVQRSSLQDKGSDGPLDSPYSILSSQLTGVNLFLAPTSATNTNDPSSAKSSYKRPKKVQAIIVGPRRPTGTRPPSPMPPSVGNLGNQELLLRKGIRQSTFQGGHLIGDELLPNSIDSMEDWNLAPQNSEFNHPVYFGLVEEQIFKGPVNTSTGLNDKSIPIQVDVDLTYPSTTFQVTVQELIKRGVVAAIDISNKGIPTSKIIYFPIRVPTKWDVTAKITVSTAAKFPIHSLTQNQQDAFHGTTPSLAPFDFSVSSPHLQTSGSSYLIGGGSSLSLFGLQGNTSPTNTNTSISGTTPTISAPAFVPPPLFAPAINFNSEIMGNGGKLTSTIETEWTNIPGVAKTHIQKLNAKLKRRYHPYAGGSKMFIDKNEFLGFVKRNVPTTNNGKAFVQRLTLDSSMNF